MRAKKCTRAISKHQFRPSRNLIVHVAAEIWAECRPTCASQASGLGFEPPVRRMRRAVQQPNVRPKTNAPCLRYAVGLLLALAMLIAWWDAAAAEPKKVVLLHSFGRDFKPWGEYARAIRTELERRSPWQLEISDHSL